MRDVLGRALQPGADGSYEVTDPTVDCQIIALRATNADVLISGGTAKFAAQAIRKVNDSAGSRSISSPAARLGAGVIDAGRAATAPSASVASPIMKDPNDPAWAATPAWRVPPFMAEILAGRQCPWITTTSYGYTVALAMMQILRQQCEGNVHPREHHAEGPNLKDWRCRTLLPGITVDTSPTDYHPLQQLQLVRWDGQIWQRFGKLITGSEVSSN